ncbi:MAG: MGMT family protein [Litorivicinus sp.]
MTPRPAAEPIYWVLHEIPAGCWCSYGDVAHKAGLPGHARWVGQLLSKLPGDSTLPWWRVMNSQGRIAFDSNDPRTLRQIEQLANEGLHPVGGRYPAAARWHAT